MAAISIAMSDSADIFKSFDSTILVEHKTMNNPKGEVTDLLARLSAGDRTAENDLMTLVYSKLHRQAVARMRLEGPAHTLQPTALVHEVYVRLCGGSIEKWADSGHFFRIAARMMRRVLIDHARRRKAAKRGLGVSLEQFEDSTAAVVFDLANTIQIDDLLNQLERLNTRQAQVVEMRFFGGLTETEIAVALNINERTVKRDWLKARAWLHERLVDDSNVS